MSETSKWFIFWSVVLCFVISGCMLIQKKITPASIDPQLIKYAGVEPNKVGYQSMEKLEKITAAAKVQHIMNQAEWNYYITRDNAVFAEVAKQAEAAWKQADADRNSLFGSGGLLGIGIGLLGGGTLASIATSMWKNSTMYSEAENQLAVNNAVQSKQNDLEKILYTQAEVDALLNKAMNVPTAVISAAVPATPAT